MLLELPKHTREMDSPLKPYHFVIVPKRTNHNEVGIEVKGKCTKMHWRSWE